MLELESRGGGWDAGMTDGRPDQTFIAARASGGTMEMKERLGWMDGLGMDGQIHSDLVTVSG